MNDQKMSPIFLSPGNRRIVVFGGGRVALRKCRHFDGFSMVVIADAVLDEIRALAEEVVLSHIDERCVLKWITDADLVIAATDNKGLNTMIKDISLKAGIPVNSAHGGGDVLIPSVLKRRNYTIMVSTEGRVPAFPPYLVDQLDSFLDDSYDSMMDLLIELRSIIRERISTQPGRAEYLAAVLADDDVWENLRCGNLEKAKEIALGLGGLQ